MIKRIVTPCRFLEEEQPIELYLEDGILSDHGHAYSEATMQVADCEFRPYFSRETADLVCKSLVGVEYDLPVFSIKGITEENLESSVLILVNAMLLFYALIVGARRLVCDKTDWDGTPLPTPTTLRAFRVIDPGDEYYGGQVRQ